MSVFKQIVLAFDGSEPSKRAFNVLKEIAEKEKIKVLILNAFEPLYITAGYHISPTISEKLRNDLQDNSNKLLQEAKNELINTTNSDVEIETLSIIGDTGEVIVEMANKYNASLIIMGSRGLGTIKSVLLGSSSNYVLHHSNRSVLIVH